MSDKITRKELLEILSRSPETPIKTPQIDELDQKALEGYQYLDQALPAEKVLGHLDERFDRWVSDREVSKGKNSIKRSILPIIQRIAAVLLLLLVPAIFLLKPASPGNLADRYFEAPLSNYLNLNRGEVTPTSTDIQKAFSLYERGQYTEAARAIGDLVQFYPDLRDLKFYQGISLFASGNLDDSIALLMTCAKDDYQDLRSRTPWYLAMAFLKKGDRTRAKMWLELTVTIDPSHRQSALEIIDKL